MVICGYGPVGRALNEGLKSVGLDTLILEMNSKTVLELKRRGQPVIFADATHREALDLAGVVLNGDEAATPAAPPQAGHQAGEHHWRATIAVVAAIAILVSWNTLFEVSETAGGELFQVGAVKLDRVA